jgi:hypothetical protein
VSPVVRTKPPANCQRPTATFQLPTANCQRPTANGQLPTANGHFPPATCHMPPASCQLPHATCRFLLTEKLLLRRTLPLPQLALLAQHLLPEAYPDALLPSTASLARAWSDTTGIQSLPLPQQGYLTTGLQLCLAQLPRGCMESPAGAELLGLLMTGVSSRLASPLPAVRLQVGAAGRAAMN